MYSINQEQIDKIKLIKETSTTMLKELKKDEVESECGYFSGYCQPRSIVAQTNYLRKLSPDIRIGLANVELAERPLHPNTEGWFAIPRWQTFAKKYKNAVEKVLRMVHKTRGGAFMDNCRCLHDLRQTHKAEGAFECIGDEQKGYDILIIQAQFGIRHRGRSVSLTRQIVEESTDEFGLGTFAIGIMMLTHPERFMSWRDLWVNCIGDGFVSHRLSNEFSNELENSPYFSSFERVIAFGRNSFDEADANIGSATGFFF